MRTEEMYTLLALLGSENISRGSSEQSCVLNGVKQQQRGSQSTVPSVPVPATSPPEGELFVQRAGEGGDTGGSAGSVYLARACCLC